MNNLMKWVLAAIVVVAIVLLITQKTQKPEVEEAPMEETEPIVIGVSAPLTGEAASFGEGMLGGGQLAAKEINEAGGINGRELKLVFEDDGCNAKDGTNAMHKLVNIDNVDAVVGPLCSAAAGASLPIAQGASVPTIDFGSAPHLPMIGEFIFRSYPSDSFQGVYAAEFAHAEMGAEKVAILYSQNDWGQGIRGVFKETFEGLGGMIVFDEGVTPGSSDVRTLAAKIKEVEPDLVYIPLYPAEAIPALKQMKEAGIEAPMLGGDIMDGEEFVGSGVSEGVMYTRGVIANPDDFLARVQEETGFETALTTSLTYDAVNLLTQAFKSVGTEAGLVRDYLMGVEYPAISLPMISFDENGDLESAEFELLVVKDGKSVLLEKAEEAKVESETGEEVSEEVEEADTEA